MWKKTIHVWEQVSGKINWCVSLPNRTTFLTPHSPERRMYQLRQLYLSSISVIIWHPSKHPGLSGVGGQLYKLSCFMIKIQWRDFVNHSLYQKPALVKFTHCLESGKQKNIAYNYISDQECLSLQRREYNNHAAEGPGNNVSVPIHVTCLCFSS